MASPRPLPSGARGALHDLSLRHALMELVDRLDADADDAATQRRGGRGAAFERAPRPQRNTQHELKQFPEQREHVEPLPRQQEQQAVRSKLDQQRNDEEERNE